MDIFDEDILALWHALFNNDVRYIMVGGYATNLHGYERFTGDMDLWIDDSLENRRKFRQALKDYSSTDYFMIETMQFVPGWTNFSLNNGMRLDVMVSMKGLEDFTFDECMQLAAIGEVDDVKVRFLHINHLIANKKAVNRDKDKLDVINLEKIKKLRGEQ